MALTGVSETTIRAHAERLPQALPREPLRSLSDKGSAHWRDRVEWAVVFCAALLLYFLTASRTIEWLDSGQFVLRIVSNDISDPIGLCCVHPLHFWMGRLAVWMLPVAPPFAIALVSALGGAIAVANVFGIVRALTRQALPAILAAAGLAFAHTFWRMSTYVEVYTLSAALLTAEFWALVLWDETRHARWLVLMLLANGLGLANHDLALLTLPIVGFVLLNAVRTGEAGIRTLGAAVVVWFAGASPFLWLIVREASSSGWSAAMGSALFGTFKPQVLGYVMRATYTATSVAFTLLSFPNLTLPAALLGFLRAGRMGVRRLSYRVLVAATAFHLLFVLRYGVIDQYTFLVPVYSLIAVFAGIGYAAAIGLGARKTLRWLAIILVALTPAVYVGAERTARHFHVLRSWERHKPYRDDYWYLLVPWGRGEDSAARMSEAAVALACPKGLIIVQDEMGSFAVGYEIRRQGLADQVQLAVYGVTPDGVRQAFREGRRIIFVPSDTTSKLGSSTDFHWKRVGSFYLIEP